VFGNRRDRTQPDDLRDSGLGEARSRFGGIDVPAALAGMLAAFGLAVLLGAATAALEAVRHDQGARVSSLWTAGGVATAAILVIALLVGGWVAGRMARYDGTGNGWMAGFLFALVVGGVGGAGKWADDRWNLLQGVQAPSWLASPTRVSELGVALVGIAAVLLVGGLGGALGARYHRGADEVIATAPALAERDGLVSGDAAVELDRSDYAGRHAVR
jgi:hypothetical protein